MNCVYETLEIVKNNELQIDTILDKLPLHLKNVGQLQSYLKTCKLSSLVDIHKCLYENQERFGFNALHRFDPLLKLDIPLSSLLINSKGLDTKCYNGQYFKIYEPDDIFVSNFFKAHFDHNGLLIV